MTIRRWAVLITGVGICGVLAVRVLVDDVGRSPWRAAQELLPTLEAAQWIYFFQSNGPDGVPDTPDDIIP